MGKITKLARPPVKASPPASAPIPARDVRRFENTDAAQTSNALVGPRIPDTLENVGFVLAFLSEFHCRAPASELSESAAAGLVSVIDWMQDAIDLQSKELEVDRG